MKVVTWNCAGAFRKKFHLLDKFDYDILIIQECEDPERSIKSYKEWADNYLWVGENKNKGLGIFVKNNHTIKLLNWSDKNINWKNELLESFLPCKINDNFTLLGVWTKKANSDVFCYMGQFWKYLQLHRLKLENNEVIIAGDFNSNTIWDKWDRWWNHSDVVKELKEINIKSLYHKIYKEEQGQESTPTFFHQKNINKPYHIDYIFLSEGFIKDNTKLLIENKDLWLEYSDHLPLVFEIE